MKGPKITLSPTAEVVINLANDEASAAGRKFIRLEHLILGILREGRGKGSSALVQLGANLREMRDLIRNSLTKAADEVVSGTLPLHPFTRRAIRRAAIYAAAEGSGQVADHHLLLAVIERPRPSIVRLFEGSGIEIENLRLVMTGAGKDGTAELPYRPPEPKRRWWRWGH
jgi:ATP-dependent Clp protease ATP-binding subunit ClpC